MPLRSAKAALLLPASARPKSKASQPLVAAHSSAQACRPVKLVPWNSVSLNWPSFVSSLPHSACSLTSSNLAFRHASSSVHRDGAVQVEWQLDWHSLSSAAMFAAGVSTGVSTRHE